MGCASSKSTPTVESNTNPDTLPQTLLNNGKSMMMKNEQDISDQVDQMKNDFKGKNPFRFPEHGNSGGLLMQSVTVITTGPYVARLRKPTTPNEKNVQLDALSITSNTNNENGSQPGSPTTQRVERSADNEDEMGFDDREIPPFTAEERKDGLACEDEEQNNTTKDSSMEKTDEGVSEKPSTPMPEDNSDSNACTDSEDYATGKSVNGDNQSMRSNNDTLNSKIMKAVCNTAAKEAMDSDTESLQRNVKSRNTYDSRKNEVCSDSEAENGENYPSSSAFSTFEKLSKGKKGKRYSHDDSNARFGHKFRKEMESRRRSAASKPCTEAFESEDEGNCGTERYTRSRTSSINSDSQCSKCS